MSSTNKIDLLALKRLKVLDEDNNELMFSQLWEGGTTIFVFIRHFGCISCRAHVDQILNRRKDIVERKNRIVFIGSGSASSLKMFKAYLGVKNAPIFTDPTLQTFKACGLLNGLKYLVNTKTLKKMFELRKQGYENQITDFQSGSHKQMGGVVALKDPGILLYHFISEYLGDLDNPEDWPDK
jgi:hypothetical protein